MVVVFQSFNVIEFLVRHNEYITRPILVSDGFPAFFCGELASGEFLLIIPELRNRTIEHSEGNEGKVTDYNTIFFIAKAIMKQQGKFIASSFYF